MRETPITASLRKPPSLSISRDVGVGQGQSNPPSPRGGAGEPDGVVVSFVKPNSTILLPSALASAPQRPLPKLSEAERAELPF